MQMLEKYFDTAFDAPDGIKKLRELILTLAMQGKLVPQDPNDQPASELLKEIENEKQQLIKDGKIKKSKSLPLINDNEKLFAIPNNWKWVRFNDVLDVRDGTHDTPRYVDTGYPLVTSKNLYTGVLDFSNVQYISEEDHAKINERSKVDNGDILFAMIGSIGNPAIVDTDIEFSIKNVALFKYYGVNNINNNYLYRYLLFAQEKMKTMSSGAVQKFVSLGFLRNFLLPLPPLNEQKRIVEKINQLMALCDELEKLKEQKEAKKLAVHKSAINQLLDSKDESTSQKGWNFISNYFNDLYTVKENVSELRSAILQLAMQGKLVPQDPNDKPASELLKKLKKIKNISEVNSNEMSFSLPQNWEWERIVNLGMAQTGTTPPKKDPEYYGNFIPFIGPGNIKNGVIDYSGESLSEKGIEKGRLIEKDSILMVCIGGSIGKHAITNQDISCNQQINTLTVYPELSTQYVYWAMASQYFQNTVINQAGGSATPIINKLKWSSIPIPVPPKNEQLRIVEKINQLMALCDDLEKQIENSSSKQTELLNAIMSNLGK